MRVGFDRPDLWTPEFANLVQSNQTRLADPPGAGVNLSEMPIHFGPVARGRVGSIGSGRFFINRDALRHYWARLLGH